MQDKLPASQSSKMLYSFQFSFLFRDFATPRHKNDHNSAVVHPMGLYLASSCSSRDSALESITLHYVIIKWWIDFLKWQKFCEKLALLLYRAISLWLFITR